MCGILLVHLKNKQNNLDKICDAYTALSNRGPDSGSLVIENNIILGFTRLAIMDVSPLGMQPFSHNGAKLICNGEIFNHAAIENMYDITCKSGSDCECILHLFLLLVRKDPLVRTDPYPLEEMIHKLNGDFAFAITHKQKIYFGRDRIGVRPLFYGITDDGNFALASYARALTDYCPDVKPVPPGWGEYDTITGKITLMAFPLTAGPVYRGPEEKAIREILTTATKDRLMSDRPIGCLLSGGLDSSLIASILCKQLGPDKVRTYSIGMKGSTDLAYAKKVATYLGTNHTEIIFTAQEGFDAIPHVIKDLECYDITTIRASVGMWLGAKYIANNTDDIVLFSGEGSDELFCGYLYFHHAPNTNELEQESIRLLKELYLYDALRADRCIASHGLELRVPFLDRRLIDLCLSLSGSLKGPQNGMEKYILRKAFESDYLPQEVLWRRKDGMSDGISGDTGKKWFQQIQDFVDQEISDAEFGCTDSISKEAFYYRKIYNKIFPRYQPIYDFWLPKWVDHGGNPSGRNLEVFNS